MARATLSKIQAICYSLLNVDTGTFGSYASNARYPSALIDDAIYNADNYVGMLLAKNGQDSLMWESVQEATKTLSGQPVPTNWVILSVVNEDDDVPLTEISFGQYLMLIDGAGTFGTPSGYYCIKDDKIFFLNGGNVIIRHLSFPKDTNIKSPDGFEEAIALRACAILTMKRADNPLNSEFFMTQFKEFMTSYITIPETSNQDEVEN